ncbi:MULTISPECIES: hypothetical protein [unclassified Paenibacillus]|uniref:hypothetical protein n=1 Tax=unclassified Paenibacillus TaxID=185978 RepID=UPI00363371D5
MAKLIYAANVSLDGYIEDERGNIEWTISDDEVFAFWTDFERPIGTYLFGRLDGVLGDGERRFRSGVVHLHYRVIV